MHKIGFYCETQACLEAYLECWFLFRNSLSISNLPVGLHYLNAVLGYELHIFEIRLIASPI